MSYLKEILEAKGITMHDLAEMTGNAYSCITVMLKNDSYAFSHKKTQKKIADALGFTPNEIINGGEEMKRKLIEAEVTRATEHLARLLRTYYPDPMHCHITIFTRYNNDLDYYDARVDDGNDRKIVDRAADIRIGEDGKITEVVPYLKFETAHDTTE